MGFFYGKEQDDTEKEDICHVYVMYHGAYRLIRAIGLFDAILLGALYRACG